ncbi:serine hydrolase [Aminobacter sp. AP02]|uniref:serine hydrolase domain-containing protein n=1 Tax=Aminobacter sp. AP02 TaxID=2135737 RepID=UPI000D6AE9FB|nr:serine hydrolase [Aminobacter sp. AP02]PWK72765.1 CubicO group peptidase (beta-lactamase class C family) [Aminobacter sp. AP02]
MRVAGKILRGVTGLVILAVAGLSAWLYFAPPALIRVGSGYAAKIVCSNVFIAGRDAGQVLADDVQAPGHPLLRLMSVHVDESAGTVRAGLFGVFGKGLAGVHEGAGCSTVPDGDLRAAALGPIPPAPAANGDALWPEGERVEASQEPAINAILDDAALAGPNMRAIVVVQNGRIVGERYGEGFSAATPLLGWSMTKTVTAAIIGTLVGEGKMSTDRTGLFEPWKADGRMAISLADLMAMSSGLEFNEDYGDVTDVTRMLYLEPDMARFAEAKPLAHEVGKVFSYSSGTTLLLSRLWQDAVGDPARALAWPGERLFGPLGMTSAVLEVDARGTFAGSSYLYATAHDWARFGQFLLQDGVWNGARVLPEGYVGWMREEAPASNGEYGRGQLWLRGPEGGTPAGQDPDAGFDLPEDAFWMQGHDGQSVAVVPSAHLVVVRLGLTPSKLHYKPQAMLAALVAALK